VKSTTNSRCIAMPISHRFSHNVYVTRCTSAILPACFVSFPSMQTDEVPTRCLCPTRSSRLSAPTVSLSLGRRHSVTPLSFFPRHLS
jgi:hypothetical protein